MMRYLALSTHPLPALAVSAITVILGFGVGLEPWRLVLLGIAMLANQASVGLSNDWLDAERDRAVGRTDKPVALGLVSARAVRIAAFVTAAIAIVLTTPLGVAATAIHAIFIVSAWGYNLGLKSTPFSVVPYVVSFGLLPLLVTLSRAEPALASGWALGAGALLGICAHIANVLPDLEDDRATGVRGLPHRLGSRTSGVLIAATLAGAAACVVLGIGGGGALQLVGLGLSILLAIACATLVVTDRPPRLVFRLIIAAAVVDVVLLALAGPRLIV